MEFSRFARNRNKSNNSSHAQQLYNAVKSQTMIVIKNMKPEILIGLDVMIRSNIASAILRLSIH